jgi:hypothetical protein
VWGAAHGLTPGHGMAIVGARGTPRHAVYLALRLIGRWSTQNWLNVHMCAMKIPPQKHYLREANVNQIFQSYRLMTICWKSEFIVLHIITRIRLANVKI